MGVAERRMVIRNAFVKDETSLFHLAGDLATSFVPEQNSFGIIFPELLAAEDVCLAVAEVDHELAGYVLGFDHLTFFANGRVSWVEEIFVKERYRRDNVGAKLMAHFEYWATERNSKLVALATRRASAFYSALGYEDSATYYRRLL